MDTLWLSDNICLFHHQVKNQEGGKKGPAQDEGGEKSGGVLVSKWETISRWPIQFKAASFCFKNLDFDNVLDHAIFAMLACVILPDLSRTVRSLQDLLIVQNTLTLEKWSP